MIRLQHVDKVYVSKSKNRVEALKDVSLELGDTGLVVILGKSGSGKSTLLNILGGLDSVTGGSVAVDGVDFSDFKQRDYDYYRNRTVGFIFQDFNLLQDFDVNDNVALALQLSNSGDRQKVERALADVGLSSEYGKRRIDELSGGEKQRVAIARAVVKESSIILADEPTGNLDSATGDDIWNIFKSLSQTKLVVIVTHDRENAQKYGDRVIEIIDGRIVDDRGAQPPDTLQPVANKTTKHLPAKACFRMGSNNILRHIFKTAGVLLLSICTVFALLLAQTLLAFSPEKSIVDFIRANDVEYITVEQAKLRYLDEFRVGYVLRPSTLDYIDKNADWIEIVDNIGTIREKQDVLDMGLSFVGEALELDDDSYYTTSYALEQAYRNYNSSVEVDGEIVKLVQELHPTEFLVGKKVDLSRKEPTYVLAGVIDVDGYNPIYRDTFPSEFAKPTYRGRFSYFGISANIGHLPEVVLRYGETDYKQYFSHNADIENLVDNGGMIFTQQGLQPAEDVILDDNQIVMNYELYAQIFSVSPKWSYVNTDITEPIFTPPHLGETFPLRFYEADTGELLLDAGELQLVGIAFERTPEPNPFTGFQNEISETFTTGPNVGKKIGTALKTHRPFLVEVASIQNLNRFLRQFRKKHEGMVTSAGYDESTDYADWLYSAEHTFWLFKYIFLTVAVVLGIILILTIVNLISRSIVDRKKEIGILSALGATNADITKIFLVETLLLSLVTFIVTLVLLVVSVLVFNRLFCFNLILKLTVLRIDFWTILTAILGAFGLPVLATLLPILKILRLKPIDAIKYL